MAGRGLVDGWTVVRQYHPEPDPDGSLCGSALADLDAGLKAREAAAMSCDRWGSNSPSGC